MMAFGAGALLFAVTVELYGHALMEVAAGKTGVMEMFTTIFGALLGAAFYLTINRWLEEYLKSGNNDEERCLAAGPAQESDALMDALLSHRHSARMEVQRSNGSTEKSPTAIEKVRDKLSLL